MALADVVDPEQQPAMAQIEAAIRQPDFDPVRVQALIRALHRNGQIDKVHMLSALHVLTASPRVGDLVEAARLVGQARWTHVAAALTNNKEKNANKHLQ